MTTVAAMKGVKPKILISLGLGCDRFNHVSDAASLRAVAELTAEGGFLGAVAMEPTSPSFLFYRDCLDHINSSQDFRSVLAGAIASAGEGHFGGDPIPPRLQSRVAPGEIYLWPLMSVLWAFDVEKVAARSSMSKWIRSGPAYPPAFRDSVLGQGPLR